MNEGLLLACGETAVMNPGLRSLAWEMFILDVHKYIF